MFIPLWVITLFVGMIAGVVLGVSMTMSGINHEIDKAKERKTNNDNH